MKTRSIGLALCFLASVLLADSPKRVEITNTVKMANTVRAVTPTAGLHTASGFGADA